MKKTLFPLFSALAAACTAAMLFFAFFTLGWFSDVRGWEWGFEVQINTADGAVVSLGDIFWTVAPFGVVLSLVFSVFQGKGEKMSAFFSTLPLALYAFCQILLYFGGKETRLPIWVNLFFLILIAVFTVGAAFFSELKTYAVLFPLFHLAASTVLFLLSLILQEKLSPFYFSELLPMGHTSYFRYTFVLWSILFYYLAYDLALIFGALAKRNRAAYLLYKSASQKPKKEEAPTAEEESLDLDETDDSSLPDGISLEDLGIER